MTQNPTELWYLPSGMKYTTAGIPSLVAAQSQYCRVFSCPEREMLTKTVPDLAAELLDITNAADWMRRGLRPMRWGDMAVLQGRACMFLPAGDTAAAADYGDAISSIEQVPRWPMAAIAILRKSQNANPITH